MVFRVDRDVFWGVGARKKWMNDCGGAVSALFMYVVLVALQQPVHRG